MLRSRVVVLPLVAAGALLATVTGCGNPRYTAPPTPQFVGAQPVAGASDLGGESAPTVPADAATVEIDPADVVADLAPGESLPDDAGWSPAAMVVTDDAGRATPNFSGWAAFDAAIERRLGGNYAAGVAVMVAGEVVHAAAFGERVAGDPTDVTDRFRVASISKTITAITALRLVDDGVVGLDDPIGDRVAAYVGVIPTDPDVAGLTLRRLLSHTTGFAKSENLYFGNGAVSCADAASRVLAGSVPPGAGYRYSNSNYCVAGLLIEALTGKAYERVVHEQLLDPLGIDGMRFTSTYELGPDEVDHHPSPNRNFMEALGGAGAWNATPADVVTIVNSIDPSTPGWKALSPESMAAMQPPAVGGYGLGLIGYPAGFGHTGTIQNTHAMVLAQPDGITWAVTVAGESPSESSQLQSVVRAALAEAFPG